MVFQKPNPFPMSIYDNIAFAPRTFGIKKRTELDRIVEESLKKASIFDEVKDLNNLDFPKMNVKEIFDNYLEDNSKDYALQEVWQQILKYY